jgi:hypothetical protein
MKQFEDIIEQLTSFIDEAEENLVAVTPIRDLIDAVTAAMEGDFETAAHFAQGAATELKKVAQAKK